MDCSLTGIVPTVLFSGRQNELGVFVCGHELGNESICGKVSDSLTVTKELVPFNFAERFPLAFELGEGGGVPEIDVGRVLEERFHVICIFEAELFEGGADGC